MMECPTGHMFPSHIIEQPRRSRRSRHRRHMRNQEERRLHRSHPGRGVTGLEAGPVIK